MANRTRYICRCGREAIARERATGEWFCLRCALDAMLEHRRRGDSVTVSFGESGISDVLIVPGGDGDGDLLAPLVEVIPSSFCRN